MDFKELMQADIDNTFMNTMEFAELHRINGKDIPVVIDSESKTVGGKMNAYHATGVSTKEFVINVAADDYGKRLPRIGAIIDVDCEKCVVKDTKSEYGIYVLTLEQRRG